MSELTVSQLITARVKAEGEIEKILEELSESCSLGIESVDINIQTHNTLGDDIQSVVNVEIRMDI